MKRVFLSVLAFALAVAASAQSVRPVWELHFQASLINDEFGVSHEVLAPSGTLAALRLSPYGGLSFGHGEHRLMGGFDIAKDYGAPDKKAVTELAVWYQYHRKGFTLAAGIFPASLQQGHYSTLIFSDARRFYNAHYDGLYLGWKRKKSLYEVALDWNGKYGEVRREQFNVMTYGAGWITPWVALCWEGMFHHYASSDAVKGVVDDHILHPYVQFEFSSLLPLDRLELSLGAVAGYQMDRLTDTRHLPVGADVVTDVRKWGFGIRNHFYYGESQTPFYQNLDAAGSQFGSELYFRSSWWQIRSDGEAGLYDRLDAYWMKSLGRHVELGVHAVFHFDHQGVLGFQQLIQAKVNL